MTKNKNEEIKNKNDLFKIEKDKIYLSKDDKENFSFSEKRHRSNENTFNTLLHIVKLPYYISYKLPVFIIKKITFKSTREQKQKELERLKKVMESKEKARNSNILTELAFEKAFEIIGFKDKLNNYPIFQESKLDGDKETLIFKSNIALNDWISKKDEIETVLNTNVISINQFDNKQIVSLETTKKNIPDFITWNDDYLLDGLKINLGVTALENIIIDMENYTSGIIAGSVGSGKSVSIIGILIQLLLKKQKLNIPVEFVLFDGKGGLDLEVFSKYGQFTTEIDEFKEMLNVIWEEYQRRKEVLRGNAQKLSEYNKKFPDKKLPDIFIVIDELSVITETQGLQGEEKTTRQSITKMLADLARLGRALGIHILLGIQVPNMQSCPGFLKNVLDMRISGFLFDESASKIILNNNMASRMEHVKGRMIFGNVKYQAYYFSLDLLDNIKPSPKKEIDTSKMIDISKKRKKEPKRDKNNNVIADIDLSNE